LLKIKKTEFLGDLRLINQCKKCQKTLLITSNLEYNMCYKVVLNREVMENLLVLNVCSDKSCYSFTEIHANEPDKIEIE